MSVTSGANRIDYVAASGQTVFAYNFRVDLATDFQVFQNGALLTLTTEYSVDGLTLQGGGDVTFVTGATVGDEIIILRVLPITQLSDYVLNEGFPSDRVEQDFDNLVMICQQISEKADRVLTTVTLQTGNVADRVVVYESPTAQIGYSTLTYDGNEFKVGTLTIDDEPGILPVIRSDKSMQFRFDADDDSAGESIQFAHGSGIGSNIIAVIGDTGMSLRGSLTSSGILSNGFNIGQATSGFSFAEIYMLGMGFFEGGLRTGTRTTVDADYVFNAFVDDRTATGAQNFMVGLAINMNLHGNDGKTDHYYGVEISNDVDTQDNSETINETIALVIRPIRLEAGGRTDTITENITLQVDESEDGVTNLSLFVSGGTVKFADLAGSGSRTVVADANGVLSAP